MTKRSLLPRALIFSLLFCPAIHTNAQNVLSPGGGREAALAYTTVAFQGSFSSFHNQAGLANETKVSAGFLYHSPYLVSEWSEKGGFLSFPTRTGTFSADVMQTGLPEYSETRFGLSYAKSLGPSWSAGIKFTYHLMEFPEEGTSRGVVFPELGVQYYLSHILSFGFHASNPMSASISSLNHEYKIPSIYRAGLGYHISNEIELLAEAVYISDSPWQFKGGMEYEPLPDLFLRAGISGKPVRYSAGLGYRWKLITTDVAINHHQRLGYSPTISFIVTL